MSSFEARGLATIEGIPTERYHQIIDALVATGWLVTKEYDGMDAGIDYGRTDLSRGAEALVCEWDNWSEGSLEGLRATIDALGVQHALPVVYRSRWR